MAACSLWLREHHCNFIMVCLPQSHSFLYEQVADLTKLNAVSQVVVKRWTYHFVNDVLLRDSADAMTVNWCELISRYFDLIRGDQGEMESLKL